MKVAVLVSRIRVEERLLIEEFLRRGVALEVIDVRDAVFDIHDGSAWERFDAVIERCISQTQALTAVRVLERFGVACVNSSGVIDACGDKLTTSLLLARAGVATPRVRVAVEAESALRAVEANGYPAILKPTVGSWGRLLARVNDRDAAEAVIEHKSTLGAVQHGVFYVQEQIDKPGRDIRVFVVGTEAIAAITRASAHWITNTARGGQAAGLEIGEELRDISERAARAVAGESGGLLAIDLLECPRRGLMVSEINHTMEFRNSITTTGVDIPGRMVEHVLRIGQGRHSGRALQEVGCGAGVGSGAGEGVGCG